MIKLWINKYMLKTDSAIETRERKEVETFETIIIESLPTYVHNYIRRRQTSLWAINSYAKEHQTGLSGRDSTNICHLIGVLANTVTVEEFETEVCLRKFCSTAR